MYEQHERCLQGDRDTHSTRLEMARAHNARNGVHVGRSRRRVSSGYTSDKEVEETKQVSFVNYNRYEHLTFAFLR